MAPHSYKADAGAREHLSMEHTVPTVNVNKEFVQPILPLHFEIVIMDVNVQLKQNILDTYVNYAIQ